MALAPKNITALIFLAVLLLPEFAKTQTNISQANISQANTSEAMVTAAHPIAAQAGYNILKQGGSAMDAAIAVQAMLGLVEPQSSGLGGGGFLLHYEASTKTLTSWDGRETAPAHIDPDVFAPFTQPRTYKNYMRAIINAQSIGVPGIPDLLIKAHRQFGTLDWEKLFEPAIERSKKGFPISARLYALLERDAYLPENPPARQLYYQTNKTGKPPARPFPRSIGEILKNPAYAETLKQFAHKPRASFYSAHRTMPGGKILKALSQTSNKMNAEDLANYQAIQRPNLCRPYRAYKVCSMGPPSSGGITLLQTLGILSHFDLSALQPADVKSIHLIAEASRLSFADRNHYLADQDFVAVPIKALLDPAYLKKRAALIHLGKAMPMVAPGNPAGTQHLFAAAQAPELPSTTHFTLRDFDGNIVSFTSSVESAFGARLMVGGMMLNNQLTDFSFVPDKQGIKVANAVEGGKRPRSSMTPVIIFDAEGNPFAALGSPGGAKIIGYVTQTIIALLDWNMDMQDAINLPRHVNPYGVVELEAGTILEKRVASLEKMGHQTKINQQHSGLHGIRMSPTKKENHAKSDTKKLDGGADPRREGVVLRLRRKN